MTTLLSREYYSVCRMQRVNGGFIETNEQLLNRRCIETTRAGTLELPGTEVPSSLLE